MADENVYEVTTEVKPEQTIVIPPQVSVPDVRWAIPSGTLAQGDVVNLVATLKDKDGNPKPLEFPALQISYTDWPSDPTQEILAIFYLTHVISTKSPVIQDDATPPPTDPIQG